MNNGRILITGGTGFAGSHLIEFLLASGTPATEIHTTYYTDIPEYMQQLMPAENFHQADLTSAEVTTALITSLKPAQIYHLAAFASVGNSFEKSRSAVLNNIGLQLNLLEAVHQHSPQSRILLIGSADSYGISESESEIPIREDHPFRPINPYGVSKLAQEMLGYAYGKSWQLDIVRVRPFNHIGERQTEDFAVPSFAKQIVAVEKGQQASITVGNVDAVRDFCDVKDMVRAYALLMEKGVSGEVYNVGSGVGTSMSDLLDQLIKLSTIEVKIEVDQSKIRALDIPVIIANNEKISQLGWSTTIPLEQSLHRVLDYWRAQ